MKPPACANCPMEDIGESWVGHDGPQTAEIVLVGEAPGAEEVDKSKPFVGGAGRLLMAAMSKAGLSREQVYITNVVKCRPPNNEIPNWFHTEQCTSRYLDHELEQLKPKLIVALGDTAAEYLFKSISITRWRGSLVDSRWGKVLLSLHPAYIMRQYDMMPILILDLMRAKRYCEKPEEFNFAQNFVLSPTLDEVKNFTSQLIENNKLIFFDIESTYSGAILCISFSDGEKTLCVPFLNRGGTAYWSDSDEIEAWKCVMEIISSSVPKCAHNSNFDIGVLEDHLVECNNVNDDTMLMHHTLYSELPHKLEFINSIYTPIPFFKTSIRESEDEKLGMIEIESETLRRYNCLDSFSTSLCYRELLKELEESPNLYKFYKELQIPLMHSIRKMSQHGILVDGLVVDKYQRELMDIEHELKVKMDTAVSRELNIDSPKQMRELLFGDLGFKPTDRTPSGEPSTDEKALRKMLLYADPDQTNVLNTILDTREVHKLRYTYLSPEIGRDGKVHSTFTIGTVTGRLASRKPNMQNLPRESTYNIDVKCIYIPLPGNVFVCADYSQIEFRILAYLSGCETLIMAFERGIDIHALNAKVLYNLSELPGKNSRERAFAKIFVYATSYGGGARTLRENAAIHRLVLSNYQAVEFIKNYERAYPEVLRWRESVARKVLRTRTYTTSFGRRRMFFGREESIRGEAYNFPIQGSAAEIINNAFLRMRKLPFVLQAHDELVAEVPERDAEATALYMKEEMEKPVQLGEWKPKIPVDIRIGTSLGTLSPWKISKNA